MYKNIPEELKNTKQWICYKAIPRGEKITKVPVHPISGNPIDANNKGNWLTFEEARVYAGGNKVTGIGFVFTDNDDFVGIDIDGCVDVNGKFNQVSMEILNCFKKKAYAEYSPSGRGIHLIVKGEKTNQRSKNSVYGLEVYSDKRYFTVTGNVIEEYGEINWCSNEIEYICNKFLEKEEKQQEMALLVTEKESFQHTTNELLEVMFSKKNGDRLKNLFEGTWQQHYQSQSEADLAFCNALAFYTKKNHNKMNEIFRQSGLFRKKWDTIHYADGRTYGDAVIEEAINSTQITYTHTNNTKQNENKVKIISEMKSAEKEIPKWYIKGTNSLSFMPGILAKHLAETENLIYTSERFFQYDKGVYCELTLQKMKKVIQEHLLVEHSKAHHIQDTLEQLKNRVVFEGDIFDSPILINKINFKNGIYNIRSQSLEPHSPEIKTAIQINADYNRFAQCPNFLQFINQSLTQMDVLIAQELLGYLLVPETVAEKAYILYGPGRTGKSTFLKLIEFIIGKKHISNVPLQDLSQKFKTGLLFGKLANIYADLPNKALQDTGIFKTLVSGDTIVAEEKFQSPFSFSNKARLLFSCNELPANYVDRTDGFFRRLIILPFLKQVEESKIDTALLSKLQNEIDGIVQWALEGLIRLMDNNYQFTKSDTTQNLLNEYRKQSNNVIWFVEEYCELLVEASEYSINLYQRYKRTCIENNMQPISQTKFNKSLEIEYGRNVIKTEDSNKRVIFKGIRTRKK
ncbi:phage/plasmid primase, P4 family [Lysinibacillus sp. G4S2]|uniref:phage/plasmid primase, P4 family n=1 Tax=Lysinibacillus sp. G4S2 TaxID=3055859 RepID=UPI0025A1B42F|nr:phage/plasmid primase, P4 family [Lysinibacillus sp. G4S2]MDM5250085.1 phage/plasmid primase, P4 family [Lysinibacillus sp. G4S2]